MFSAFLHKYFSEIACADDAMYGDSGKSVA